MNAQHVRDRVGYLPIVVSIHARERMRLRFPGIKAARIVDEVRDALAHGRMSSRKPEGITGPDDPESPLYLWTKDGTRVYAVRTYQGSFWVTTTMRAFDPNHDPASGGSE